MENTPGLTFNEELHEYRYNGEIVPSVTQLLSAVGLPDLSGIPEANLKIGQERGKKVHQITELWDRHTLDESGLSESGHKYLAQWAYAWDMLGRPEWTGIEVKLYADGFAGTPDRVFINEPKRFCLLPDIKTGYDLIAVGPQTAGYEWLIKKCVPKIRKFRRVSVRLDIEQSRPKLEELNEPADTAVFQSSLNIYNFKTRIKKH